MNARFWIRLLRALLLVGALGLVVVTILPSADTTTWWIRNLDFPRLEFLIGMVLVGIALVLLPWTRLSLLALLGLGAASAYNGWVLAPYAEFTGEMMRGAATCPENDRLRVLEVNVEMTNRNYEKLLSLVWEAHPDVAWFQEVDDWWAMHLAPLTAELPNVVKEPQPNYFGVELMSRLPLVDPRIMHLTSSANPSVFTGMRLPSGTVAQLYAVHPRPPQVGQSTLERRGQLMAAALAAHDDRQPHLIAGDMNSVPWEDVIRSTERIGGFLDPRVGRGLFITWNAKHWVLRWPLDQILPGRDFTLLSLRVLPPFGSDHKPYLAELCYTPDASRSQSPPPLRPNDIATATQAVRDAQNAADKEGYKGRYGPDGTRTD